MIQINLKRLLCVHSKNLMHLQYSQLKFTTVRNSHQTQQWFAQRRIKLIKSKSITKLMQSKTIKESQKPVLYYNNCSLTQRLVLSCDIEKTLDPQVTLIKLKLNTTYYHLQPMRNSKRLLCIHCKKLKHLQYSQLEFTRLRNSQAHTR